jgi:hypothetical protein
MNIKHRAYALTEMLVIITALMVLISLSVKPLRTFMSEIPRSARVCQSLNATQKALKQVKKDIEQSTQIVTLQDDTLILEYSDTQITYILTDGTITRRPGLNPQDDEYTWQLPNIRLTADLWSQNNKPNALELMTWNQQTVLGKEQKQFKQSMVFFQKDKWR